MLPDSSGSFYVRRKRKPDTLPTLFITPLLFLLPGLQRQRRLRRRVRRPDGPATAGGGDGHPAVDGDDAGRVLEEDVPRAGVRVVHQAGAGRRDAQQQGHRHERGRGRGGAEQCRSARKTRTRSCSQFFEIKVIKLFGNFI